MVSRHRDAVDVVVRVSARRVREPRQFRDAVDRRRDVYFDTLFMAGILSSQSYLQMKTLSAALEQSEEIMQWINVISARCVSPRFEVLRCLHFLDMSRLRE